MGFCLIDIGQRPDEPANKCLHLPLPTQTTYGDFALKWVDMIARLNESNRQIIASYETWDSTKTGHICDSMGDVFNRHRFSTEYAVFGMRRVADEIVALLWCLETQEATGKYPSHVKAESIGRAFKIGYQGPDGLLARHESLLRTLNDLSNAFKHSFVQSDVVRASTDEPVVVALNLKDAKLANGKQFYTVLLASLVGDYDHFFRETRDWLFGYCKRQRL